MIKRQQGLIIICFLALALVLLIKQDRGVKDRNIAGLKQTTGNQIEIALHKNFYDKEIFYDAVAFANDSRAQRNIETIVVPHHLLASRFIADSMKRASGRKVKQVIIIGPNHDNIGSEKIASVSALWQTPFGYAETDEDLADKFFYKFGSHSNKEAFIKEHSIGALVPFVKYYFREAKILPVIFSSNANASDAKKVASWLAENLGENSLVIISTDFSHYLTREEAEKKDSITKELMNNNDIDAIMRLTNDNVDSPASLAAGMIYVEKKGLAADFAHHANSFDLVSNKSSSTTSYFAILFHH